jgi:hypothetical protein
MAYLSGRYSLRYRLNSSVNRFEPDIQYPSPFLGTENLENCDVQAVEKLRREFQACSPRPDYAMSTQ